MLDDEIDVEPFLTADELDMLKKLDYWRDDKEQAKQ